MTNPPPATTASPDRIALLSLLTPGVPLIVPDFFALAQRHDLEWDPFLPGVERCWVYRTGPDGPAAALIRFQPGGRVPLHEHVGYEHIFVLSGSQEDEQGVAAAGSLLVNPPGTRHSVVSPYGCIVLAIYEKPVKFLEKI